MYNIVKIEGGVCASAGFFADGVSAGLKPNGDKDLAFIYSDVLCDVASVFTTNKMTAAPIRHFRQKGKFKTNFILINSKNANAMTGKDGIKDIEDILNKLSSKNNNIKNPIMSSTGVIGVRIPKQKIIDATELFDITKKDSLSAAKAIMTTDSFHKQIAFRVELDDGSAFNIGAIAKGAGMINPAMATMLCFITTDADIAKSQMQKILEDTSQSTFNAASVDGDTSTNDTVILLSSANSKAYHEEAFREALHRIMLFLAKEMVRDGEGATKLVTYNITGAKDDIQAETIAKALSNSLLMKTAIYGQDPNWGRVASTIGASGADCDEAKLKILFDDICVYDCGKIYFDKETEKEASQVMIQDSFSINCDIGIADGNFSAYGCDLGYEYVKINADYRT